MTAVAGGRSLAALARLYGIQLSYYSNRRRITPRPEAVLATLQALGADVSSPADAGAALREQQARLDARVIEPVHVVWDGKPAALPLKAPVRESVLRLESGETREVRPASGGSLRLPRLPLGYHRLTLSAGGSQHQCLVISAPSRAYAAPDAGRIWGVFMPLYAVRSSDDWGVGDFTHLRRLAHFTARKGSSLLATLPIMATFLDFPFNPSPYAPASRLFWNELFLNVESIPEIAACRQARALIASPQFQRDRQRLRSATLVDYEGAASLKRKVLSLLAAALSAARLRDLQAFVRRQPHLARYARFRAACEHYHLPWYDWPDSARSGHLEEASLDPQTVRYHQYAQWVAECQLNGVRSDSSDAGVDLYLDLPLGASRESYDVWRYRETFAHGAAVGAPPDALFPNGQNWAFPPPHPEAVRSDGYAYFIEVVRRLMSVSGAVRIDHVMGLHRLFWVPEGLDAKDGVYVHYHADEMYAILCLESYRNQAVIVGEDLGTVPPYVEASLARHNIHRMYVLQYEIPGGERAPVKPAPARGVAALNTHDTPPFAAWLDGEDIDAGARLGFLDAGAADEARSQRKIQRQTLSVFLHGRGLAPASSSPGNLLRGSLRYLASSRARMLLVNLEDLWLETKPQNIPGTTDDRNPNWRRKAARTLEDIESDPAVSQLLDEVSAARGPRSAK